MLQRIEGLLNKIPGYKGAQQKETMRDDGRRLREDIAQNLDQAVAHLTNIGQQLASQRAMDQISDLERLVSRTRHLADRVRSASYGYGGIFSNRSVDEHALSQLKAFDLAFQQRSQELVGTVRKVNSTETLDPGKIAEVQQSLADLDTLFDSRMNVIETAKPTQNQDALALLNQPRSIGESEKRLLALRKGGAISILGDNYQVTAHIAIDSRTGDPAITLARLDDTSAWLAITDDSTNIGTWRVEEMTSSEPVVGADAGTASISGPQGTQSELPVTYGLEVADASDGQSVRIRFTVGDENRVYEGKSVPTIDIEVFSQGG